MSDAVSLDHSDHQIGGDGTRRGSLDVQSRACDAGFCLRIEVLASSSGNRERGWLAGRGHSARAGHRARNPQQDSGSEIGGSLGQLWEAVWAGRAMGQGWIFRDQHLQHGRMTQMEAAEEAHKLPSPSRGLDP